MDLSIPIRIEIIYMKFSRSGSGYDPETLEKYNSVIQNINPCPFIKYEQKEDDICLNAKSCMYMETHMKDKYGKKHLVCLCFGKTSYHCDARYCALDSRACDAFKANNSRQINQCASFNVFAQRKLNII